MHLHLSTVASREEPSAGTPAAAVERNGVHLFAGSVEGAEEAHSRQAEVLADWEVSHNAITMAHLPIHCARWNAQEIKAARASVRLQSSSDFMRNARPAEANVAEIAESAVEK